MLWLWVLFDRPRDFPGFVVVRAQVVLRGKQDPVPGMVGCLYRSVAEAWADWEPRGLHWMPRQPGDEPGCWV